MCVTELVPGHLRGKTIQSGFTGCLTHSSELPDLVSAGSRLTKPLCFSSQRAIASDILEWRVFLKYPKINLFVCLHTGLPFDIICWLDGGVGIWSRITGAL